MQEQLISFETAKLAKEKCFNAICRHAYKDNNILINFDNGCCYDILSEHYIICPTQSLLQKWLREVHKKDVYCWPCESQIDNSNTTWTSGKAVGTYEDVLEVGLIEALKAIKIN